MIKAIIFDLGGVYFTRGTKIASQRIGKKYKLDVKKVREFIKTSSKFGALYRRNKISAGKFWGEFKKEFGVNEKTNYLSNLWTMSYKPIEETVRIIKNLKKRNVKLYFLSDNVKERADFLQKKYNFLNGFIGGVFSHEARLIKHDGTKIFKMAIKKTGSRPEEIVFIDDRKEHAETADKIGMNSIWFKSPGQLKKGLKKFGF